MAVIHTLLVRATAQVIHLLPRRVQDALDAWSRRVAHARALRRQRTGRPKG